MTDVFNGLYDLCYEFLDWAAGFLHICPFEDMALTLQGMATGLGWFNWFIPVSNIVDILTLWAGALVLYYAINFIASKVEATIK